ncbi:Protein of unknown function [Pyronema omphalodes CBS 100304]|uniref:Uncharacterized protein n=1 Tax=Pyronema omphalodes (strain CBS 100304) TaxID=1076935 RepID=U4LJF9_PYROM|nr:Protein of unknown function [Pyronema omphalodes CBS 100304]
MSHTQIRDTCTVGGDRSHPNTGNTKKVCRYLIMITPHNFRVSSFIRLQIIMLIAFQRGPGGCRKGGIREAFVCWFIRFSGSSFEALII